MDLTILAGLGAAAFALVHLLAPRLHFLRGTPRSIWLSLAGGVSVAYVFVHLLPEVASGQRVVADSVSIAFVERHVWLVALVGLLVFYGLDRLAKRSRSRRLGAEVASGRSPDDRGAPDASPRVFWLHIASFSVYNLLAGYLLLHREEQSAANLAFYIVAIALHLLVVDFGLEADHRRLFRTRARWILAAAVIAGWLTGIVLPLDDAAVAALIAFVGGGVILNVLKEEVPSEQQSRFWAFAAGAVAYSVLLLAG